jgi:hypothetical protein
VKRRNSCLVSELFGKQLGLVIGSEGKIHSRDLESFELTSVVQQVQRISVASTSWHARQGLLLTAVLLQQTQLAMAVKWPVWEQRNRGDHVVPGARD